MQPLVSIGVPVYNGRKYVLSTLESIEKLNYRPLELIIIDDGSTDDSLEICKKWEKTSSLNVRIFTNERNIGLCNTCNEIIKYASGYYLQLIGQDDIMKPEKISRDVDFFQKQDNIPALIFSDVELIDESGSTTGEDYYRRINFVNDPSKSVFEKLILQNFIPAPSVLIRTEIARIVGGFDNNFLYEDWQMWLKIARNHIVIHREGLDVQYRIHQESFMHTKENHSEILRNRALFKMFSHFSEDLDYRQQVLKKLSSLAVYAYFLRDTQSSYFFKYCLKQQMNCKLALYFSLNILRIPHYQYWFKK